MSLIQGVLTTIIFLSAIMFNQYSITQGQEVNATASTSVCDPTANKCPPCDANENCAEEKCIIDTVNKNKTRGDAMLQILKDMIEARNLHQFCKSNKCVIDAEHVNPYCYDPEASTESTSATGDPANSMGATIRKR